MSVELPLKSGVDGRISQACRQYWRSAADGDDEWADIRSLLIVALRWLPLVNRCNINFRQTKDTNALDCGPHISWSTLIIIVVKIIVITDRKY